MSKRAGQEMRADELLVHQKLAETRSKAKALIMAGQVRLGDRIIEKAGVLLDANAPLELEARLPFVSRGGVKLEHALNVFGIDVTGMTAADIGASTGGFTDCLLQRGIGRVYAIDVGYGQLDYRLRTDSRVIVMERVNARHLKSLPERIDFACIDVSFISLDLILPAVAHVLAPGAQVIALIKPQFEAGREHVGHGGVVRSTAARRTAVERVLQRAEEAGFGIRGLTRSPITGPAGNVEFLAWLSWNTSGCELPMLLAAVFSNGAP